MNSLLDCFLSFVCVVLCPILWIAIIRYLCYPNNEKDPK